MVKKKSQRMIDLIVQDERTKKLVNGTREMTNFSMGQNVGWDEESVNSGYWEIRDTEEKEPRVKTKTLQEEKDQSPNRMNGKHT